MSDAENPTTRVFLVDDHQIVLDGLSEFFKETDDIHVAGSATSAQEALQIMEVVEVDVAVLDVRLPDMDGIALCREIRARYGHIQCLMLSSEDSADALLEALVSGAAGYLLKELPLAEVADAVRSIARGASADDSVSRVTARDEH